MSKSRKNQHGPKSRQLRFETMEDRLYLSVTPYLSLPLADESVFSRTAESQTVSSYSSFDDDVSQTFQTVGIRKVQDGLFNSEGETLQKLIFEFERTIDPDDSTALDQPLTIFCYYYVVNEDSKTHFNYNENQYRTDKSGFSYAVYCEQMITFQPGETKAYWEILPHASHQTYSVSILPDGSNITETADDADNYLVDSQNDSCSGRVQLHRDNVDQPAPTINISKVQDGILDAEGNWIQRPVYEMERVIDSNAPESLQQPLTVDYVFFTKDAHYEKTLMTLYPGREMSVTFPSGETRVLVSYDFDFDPLDDQTMYIDCVLADSLPELNGGASQYHIGANKYLRADVTINENDEIPITAPTYTISAPTEGELIEGASNWWEFSAETTLDRPIMNWEINWGDGSQETRILGGPRNHIRVPHNYRNAGKYAITIKTIDLCGHERTTTIGTYTVKEKVVEQEQFLQVNVKTIQQGAVSPNEEIQQSIIFEFERTIDPNRPDDLNQPLTVEYELSLFQGCDTDYRNTISHLLDKTLTLTFQPGETTVQLEFSGFGYIEYKSSTSLKVRLLGTAEKNRNDYIASSSVDLVNNPGEQSIPVVSLRVVPELSHGEKVVFEIERQVDPNDPHALDEPLEISYNYYDGQYFYLTILDGLTERRKIRTYELRYPKSLVFEPGQSKIVLEFLGNSDSWIDFSIYQPVGSTSKFIIGAPPQINTLPDYLVEQGYVEYDFGEDFIELRYERLEERETFLESGETPVIETLGNHQTSRFALETHSINRVAQIDLFFQMPQTSDKVDFNDTFSPTDLTFDEENSVFASVESDDVFDADWDPFAVLPEFFERGEFY